MMKTRYILVLWIVFLGYSCTEKGNSNNTNYRGEEGKNGSYTAVIAVGDRLYYVDNTTLYTADISQSATVDIIDEQELGSNIETLFHQNGSLFIGSGPTLYIYNIGDDGIPEQVNKTDYNAFLDVYPCDPVIADDEYAYVTLSSSTTHTCIGFFIFIPWPVERNVTINQLRIYDITDLSAPVLVQKQNMTNPKGLAIDGDILFVCDGSDGLKVYNVEDRKDIKLLRHFSGFEAFDVIADDGLLIVTGPETVREYFYSSQGAMNHISTISI